MTAAGGRDPVGALLGDLERAVMEVVWEREEASVRDVHTALQSERQLAYNTVMTVMSRLTAKGVLERERRGRAYVYRAVQSGKAGFVERQARQGVRALIERFGSVAIAAFAEAVDEDAEHDLDRLRELLAEEHEEHDAQTSLDAAEANTQTRSVSHADRGRRGVPAHGRGREVDGAGPSALGGEVASGTDKRGVRPSPGTAA